MPPLLLRDLWSIVWHALVTLFGIPGRCDLVWYGCAKGIDASGGGTETFEPFWVEAQG